MIAINGRELSGTDKQRVVSLFLGDPMVGTASVGEIAATFAVHRSTIEAVLREAIQGLLKLNTDVIQELADVETANAILEDANAD